MLEISFDNFVKKRILQKKNQIQISFLKFDKDKANLFLKKKLWTRHLIKKLLKII